MYREYVNMRTHIGDAIVETVPVGSGGSFDTYLAVVGLESLKRRVDWSSSRLGAWENHKQWVKESMAVRPGTIAVAITIET